MSCANEKKESDRANELWDRAQVATASAQANLVAAELTVAGSMISTVVCLVTVATGPGLALCEAAAATLTEGGLKWVESAVLGLELAEIAEGEAAGYALEKFDEWCDCISMPEGDPQPPDQPPDDGDDDEIEAIEIILDNAEAAIADSEADGEEYEDALQEYEEAVEALENEGSLSDAGAIS